MQPGPLGPGANACSTNHDSARAPRQSSRAKTELARQHRHYPDIHGLQNDLCVDGTEGGATEILSALAQQQCICTTHLNHTSAPRWPSGLGTTRRKPSSQVLGWVASGAQNRGRRSSWAHRGVPASSAP